MVRIGNLVVTDEDVRDVYGVGLDEIPREDVRNVGAWVALWNHTQACSSCDAHGLCEAGSELEQALSAVMYVFTETVVVG